VDPVTHAEALSQDVLERVLERLGLPDRPRVSLDGLGALYAAWCRRVPFDNVQKIIHLRGGHPGSLPGDHPSTFFSAWLTHGTGGTCWAGHGALHALLVTLGFAAHRGIGTMLAPPNSPPNHGTVLVDIDGSRYVVDASILHGAPLALSVQDSTSVDHPAWGVQCRTRNGAWHIRWRPLHLPDGMDCRIDALQAERAQFQHYHEGTRAWSPFNYELSARLNVGDGVVGISRGERVEIDAAGAVQRTPLDADDRVRVLVEELGLSEEVARRLPPDVRTPPPPAMN
jgi:N-hydroxyarylamine O-acetyltransferase